MPANKTLSSRRAFFARGGAVLGAGVATTAGAGALLADDAPPVQEQLRQLQQQLECAADREAIRQLHLAFTGLIENQRYEAAAELFDAHAEIQLSGVAATGKAAILQLFAEQYRHQKAAAIHSAYRQNASQRNDVVTLGDDRRLGSATFHSEVELCTPLRMDSTAAKMARLQGQVADRRWEAGRFDGQYVKTNGKWKMASLRYSRA